MNKKIGRLDEIDLKRLFLNDAGESQHIAWKVLRLTALAHMDNGTKRRVLYRATEDFVS